MNVDRSPLSSSSGCGNDGGLLISRAIVSLNNSGVSLLERARYAEGKATLRDALALAALLEQQGQQHSVAANRFPNPHGTAPRGAASRATQG